MENNINKKVVLIGPGGIARDYANVLKAMEVECVVLGRQKEKCDLFQNETGMQCMDTPLEKYLTEIDIQNSWFIVTVSTENLGRVVRVLISNNAQHILVEKPAGINKEDISLTIDVLKNKSITPFVAYNRRFYTSFLRAKDIIAEQGGLLSFSFEFTEWAHELEKLNKPKEALENWFLGNSSHVIDIAFFIGGAPKEMCSYTAGSLPWHPSAAQYSGAGVTDKGALFSYQANWQSAGRWGVEFNTTQGKLILRPMEKLFFQKKGELRVNEVQLENKFDVDFKPGLYRQVESFLKGDSSNMISIQEHYKNVINIYEKINPRNR